jgi:transposase-like protein
MRDDDGRKLDHKTLEQLRIRAIRQIEQGAHPEDVAAGLGMTRAAVYGWLAKYREGGLEALKARPVPGRPPSQACPAPSSSASTPWWSAMIHGSCSSPLPCGPGRWCGS